MAGLFTTLFGSGSQGEAAASEQQDTFFLDADSAKTLGNIDFMRTPRVVERTFPKGGRRVRKISSLKNEAAAATTSVPTSFPLPATNETKTTSNVSAARRNGDSGLDSFRQMARGMKKGK